MLLPTDPFKRAEVAEAFRDQLAHENNHIAVWEAPAAEGYRGPAGHLAEQQQTALFEFAESLDLMRVMSAHRALALPPFCGFRRAGDSFELVLLVTYGGTAGEAPVTERDLEYVAGILDLEGEAEVQIPARLVGGDGDELSTIALATLL